ncbi:hypothetical protein GCM10010106_02740 [Thermopolyspora flexuosa]|nr:hypothetical protein GCM10010106_02740 [Thermopolyspora flexuosa]
MGYCVDGLVSGNNKAVPLAHSRTRGTREKGEGCPGGIRTAAPTSGVWEQKDHRMGAEPQECPLHLVVATRSPLARPPRTAIAAVHRHRPQETKAPLPSPAGDLR